jgi:hypothetical protein
MTLLDDLIEFTQYLTGQRLVGMGSRNTQRAAVDTDPHAERLLNHMDVGVVLAEEIGKEPMVVEVEFERIFGGWLRNGFAKPRDFYSRGRASQSLRDSSPAFPRS